MQPSSTSLSTKIENFKKLISQRKKTIIQTKVKEKMAQLRPIFQNGTVTDGVAFHGGSIFLWITGDSVINMVLTGVRVITLVLNRQNTTFHATNSDIIFRINQNTYTFQAVSLQGHQDVLAWLRDTNLDETFPDEGLGSSGGSSPAPPN